MKEHKFHVTLRFETELLGTQYSSNGRAQFHRDDAGRIVIAVQQVTGILFDAAKAMGLQFLPAVLIVDDTEEVVSNIPLKYERLTTITRLRRVAKRFTTVTSEAAENAEVSFIIVTDERTSSHIEDLLRYAGRFVGLGGWRKGGQYGRFTAEVSRIE